MLSVLIVHAAPEPALAVTLSRLVEAALDTLLSDVTLLDLCDDPHAARLAEEGGCALRRHDDPAAGDLRAMAAQARRDWVLLAASGLALAPGWSQIARETLAMAQAEAPRVGSRLSGALFETPPRGALRRFVGGPEGVTLVRRDALALAPLRPASLARDAAAAARRAGRLRRIPGFCVDERV